MDRRKLQQIGEFAYLDQCGKSFFDIEGALRSLGIKWTPNLSAYVTTVCAGRVWRGPLPKELTPRVYLQLAKIWPELAATANGRKGLANGEKKEGHSGLPTS